MSGGHFDYNQSRIGEIADRISEIIDSNNDESLDEWGDPIGTFYAAQTINEFKKAVSVLRTAQIYAQRIDWLVCGDDGEECFHERLAEDLAATQGDCDANQNVKGE